MSKENRSKAITNIVKLIELKATYQPNTLQYKLIDRSIKRLKTKLFAHRA